MRKSYSVVLICLAFQALPAFASTTAQAAPADSSRAMIQQINKVRAHYGLAPMRQSPSLTRSAQNYSTRILRTDSFAHMNRIQASGNFRRLGEALAIHYGRRDKVRGTVRAWLRSPPHRAILLNTTMRWLGTGVTHGRFGRSRATVWVLQTGNR